MLLTLRRHTMGRTVVFGEMEITKVAFMFLLCWIIHIDHRMLVSSHVLPANHSNIIESTTAVVIHNGNIVPGIINSTMHEETPVDAAVIKDNYVLPYMWEPFCRIVGYSEYVSDFSGGVNMTSIHCNVSSDYSGIWKLADLRKSVEAISNISLNLDVNIFCSNNANISLPEPVMVDRLFSISVKNCVITDVHSEYNTTTIDRHKDSLRRKEYVGNTVVISMRNYISLMEHIENISKNYLCGHEETIEEIVVKNISYTFKFDMMLLDPSKLGRDFSRGATRIEHVCIYRHMMYLEETYHNSMSVYHGTLLTENAVFDELKSINMSHNHMKVLKDEQLQWSLTFPKLEMFDLSHNDISTLYRFEIPIHSTENQTTVINLQHNNISMIAVKDLDRYRDLPMMYIDLRNNRINCSCSENMKELVGYILNKKHMDIEVNAIDKNYSYIEDLKCSAPTRVAGQRLKELTTNIVCPVVHESTREYFVVPLVSMGVVLLILGIAVIVLLKYRREVLILLYTRLNIIVPCRAPCQNDDKRFDAFVSYSSKEDGWVEEFFQQLEKPSEGASEPFKFCLHHRDFIAGKTIFDNVVNSIEQSRHTIILLSRHFLKSEFCIYEFQEAFRQSISEQKRHLVIVMMENIREQELPGLLRRCIKTFTYINRRDYLFRDRLVYALSVKENTKTIKKSKHASETRKLTNDLNSKKNAPNCTPDTVVPLESKRKISQTSNKGKLTPLNIKPTYKENVEKCGGIKMNIPNAPTACTNDVDVKNNTETRAAFDNKCFEPDKYTESFANMDCTSPTGMTPELSKANYIRSMSTFSQDTGYFSSSTPSCCIDTPSPDELRHGLIPFEGSIIKM